MVESTPRQIAHPPVVPFEYTKITREIYIGTNQCCRTHFDQELLAKGVRADISLEKGEVDRPFGVDYFLWLPVSDDWPPAPAQLDTGVAALAALVSNKQKIYIHCKNGHGRAPTLAAAYLIRYQGMTPSQALDFLKKKRPVVHLTKRQRHALEQFAKEDK